MKAFSETDLQFALEFYEKSIPHIEEEIDIMYKRLSLIETSDLDSFIKDSDEPFRKTKDYLLTTKRGLVLEIKRKIEEAKSNLDSVHENIRKVQEFKQNGRNK